MPKDNFLNSATSLLNNLKSRNHVIESTTTRLIDLRDENTVDTQLFQNPEINTVGINKYQTSYTQNILSNQGANNLVISNDDRNLPQIIPEVHNNHQIPLDTVNDSYSVRQAEKHFQRNNGSRSINTTMSRDQLLPNNSHDSSLYQSEFSHGTAFSENLVAIIAEPNSQTNFIPSSTYSLFNPALPQFPGSSNSCQQKIQPICTSETSVQLLNVPPPYDGINSTLLQTPNCIEINQLRTQLNTINGRRSQNLKDYFGKNYGCIVFKFSVLYILFFTLIYVCYDELIPKYLMITVHSSIFLGCLFIAILHCCKAKKNLNYRFLMFLFNIIFVSIIFGTIIVCLNSLRVISIA